jgi:hypothetical protein
MSSSAHQISGEGTVEGRGILGSVLQFFASEHFAPTFRGQLTAACGPVLSGLCARGG